MDHPRHHFLAGSSRPQNQHGDVRFRGRPDPFENDQHLLVAADHFAEALNRRGLVFGADCRAPFQEGVEHRRQRRSLGPLGNVLSRRLADNAHEADGNELLQTVVDVEAHAPEGRHQRFDFERFVRSGVQEPEQSRTQRRLDDDAESRFVVRRIRSRSGDAGSGDSGFVHRHCSGGSALLIYRPDDPLPTAPEPRSR
jgi:hypothetical protein